MDDGYIIKFKRPENDFYEYKHKLGGYTENVKDALIYQPNTIEMYGNLFAIRYLHPEWDAEIADYRNEIGTYISTYKPKVTFKIILDTIGFILAIPILIPIIAYLATKDYIMKKLGLTKY
jgi:hypothetical protein